SYRGPEFIWRCLAYQSVWDSEFSAAITGEKAYNMTPKKIELIEAEEKNFAIGKPFHWSIFVPTLSSMEENYREITSYYASDNWRSHRAWGVSSILPWDQASLWQRVKETPDKDNPLKYKTLQKPGIVPDFFHSGAQFINDPGDESNFIPSSLGKIFLKNNMEYLGFVGGYPKFTDKSHNFLPGENIAKQLVIINDSRENVKCKYSWKIESTNIEGRGEVELKPGEIKFCPIKFKAPEKKQSLKMIAEFNFEEKWKCSDIFSFNILKLNLANINIDSEVYLFDPKGDTTRLFDESSINYKKIVSYSDFEPDENRILIIGKNALQEKDANHDFSKSDKPLKMIVFEQNEISLSNKLGFRINIYGFRNLFIRSKNHPVLTGIDEDMLRDWRGESTLTPPYLTDLEEFEEHDPQWEWCGFLNTRVWRCGNSGNVASIVIEKPERGNWLPIVDCGFDLQYSPLIEYSEGNKKIIFCQLDVSGRTENDPVALQITKNIVKYLDKVHIEKIRSVYYDGNQEGANLLEALGVKFSKLNNEKITPLNSLVVIGPNSKSSSLKDLVYQGANLLTIGLDEKTISNILPNMLKMEHFTGFSSTMENMTAKELNGISNSELHFRGKFSFDAFTEKDRDSVEMLKILKVGNGTVALVQIAPWNIDYTTKPYQRTTYRRNCFLISRLLANLHATMTTQLLANFARTPSSSILRLVKDWKGVPDKDNIGESAGWMKENFDDSTWEPILVPGMFDLLRKDLNGYDGFFWYRLKFTLPQEFENEDELTLELGGIDDESWTWLNEQFLGELTKTTNPKNYWNAPRTYTFKTEILRKKEKNTLVVKVNDTYMNGGFREQPRIKRKSAPWINSYYLQNPIAEDDPYRYYRW
ncbi:MAG TPA: beta galactosidase jelly roll domain-containing protein, partial [Victivallales bacterium]|nr:beta galactosidase jelly roll domain-containing protein [Victivallales bacterium]